MRIHSFLLLMVLGLALSACYVGTPYGQPAPVAEGQLRITFAPLVEGQPFQAGRAYTTATGVRHDFSNFEFYLTDLRLVRANGEDTLLGDLFVDVMENELYTPETVINGLTLTVPVPAADYQGIRFNVGVPTPRNNGDPSLYGSSHPLSPNRGMFWVWASGYIFMKVEGRYDTTGGVGSDLEGDYLFHAGRNELFRELSFSEGFRVEQDRTQRMQIGVDMARSLYRAGDSIDLTVDNFTHSAPPDGLILGQRIIDNVEAGVFSISFP